MVSTPNSPGAAQFRSLPQDWTSPEDRLPPAEALNALQTYRVKDPAKVAIQFKAIGNAPIMRQNKYKINASYRFQAVILFVKKEIGWKAGVPLFTYINSSFSPTPDDIVANLFKSFATDGHLIVNYSTTAAWG